MTKSITRVAKYILKYCIMSSTPLKHKCLSIILTWVIVSRKYIVKVKKKNFFYLIGKNRHGIGEKRSLFSIGNGAEIRPLEKGRKSPDNTRLMLAHIFEHYVQDCPRLS